MSAPRDDHNIALHLEISTYTVAYERFSARSTQSRKKFATSSLDPPRYTTIPYIYVPKGYAIMLNYARRLAWGGAWGRHKWSSPKPPGCSSSLAQHLEALPKNTHTHTKMHS